MKNQNFGVEIELTRITRENAARTIATYFGTTSRYIGTYYNTYGAKDRKGRTWKAMSDSSIKTERKINGQIIPTGNDFACEVVTPILQYEDTEDLQNVVRALVKNGAMANKSCGIHVHVDGANHDAKSLTMLLTFAIDRQDLFYEALEIGDRANRWCQKANQKLVQAIRSDPEKTESSLERLWYSTMNDGYDGGINHDHYNATRYHGINLHAFFTKGTVEFRLFNGTTHAGKIKAYIQFCLAMSAWAIEHKGERLYFKSCGKYSQEKKAALMKRVLVNRLGMAGPEFKTARLHLTKAFTKNAEVTAA